LGNASSPEEARLKLGHMDVSFCRNMGQAKVGFVVKGFLQDLVLDQYYDRLQKDLSLDINQLHLHELQELLDRLEDLRRTCEVGVRCEIERALPISSDLYVLRKIEAISNVPKN